MQNFRFYTSIVTSCIRIFAIFYCNFEYFGTSDIDSVVCVLLRGQGRQIFELFIYWAIARALVALIEQFKQHVKADTFLY